ncbi:serine hydrolase domain-containing protein [Celeribacter sp. ULVN23_4]
MQASALFDTAKIIGGRLIRLDITGIKRLSRVNSLFAPGKIVWNFSHLDQLFHALPFDMPSDAPSPLPEAKAPLTASVDLERYFTERNVKSFLVLKDGAIRHEQYLQGTRPDDRHISWSMSKSVTALLLGILIDKGMIPADILEAEVQEHLPALKGSGYDGVRLLDVLTMSSGVRFNEDYVDYHSDINRMGRIIGVGGSMDDFAATLTRQWPPGTYMHYVTVDTHVIGMMIRALTGQKMIDLLNTHVIRPMGVEHSGFVITDEEQEPFVAGGFNMSTRDYARLAQMMLQKGEWNGTRIVSEAWIDRMTRQTAPLPDPETAKIPDGQLRYGLQWWLPPEAREGEFFGIGIYGQYMYIHRAAGVVIAQNAADTEFRVGDGAINLETLTMFRQIAEELAGT